MDVNFELYKTFYYVAKTLSFSKASSKLFVSQSAVSQSIRALEEKLGCKLLFRNTKQVSLTQEGSTLFGHVEQAFNFIKTGERAISEMQSLNSGDIRIGASDTICKYYLMPYFKKFNEMYPGIKIHVTNRTSPKCIELLQKGIVDFSVINLPEDSDYKDMTVTKIKAIKDVFIGGNRFIKLKNRKTSLKHLENYPLIVLEKNTITRGYFDMLLKRHGLDPSPEIELGSVELLIEMAKIGLGISYVMENYIDEELKKGTIFKLDIEEEMPERYLGIISLRNPPLPAAAKRFIEMLK